MSLIANDELTKITSTTSGTINNQVIELAKKERIYSYGREKNKL